MGHRYHKPAARKGGKYRYHAMEVFMKRNGSVAEDAAAVVLTVENDWETLGFVNDNVDTIAANLMRAKQMNEERRIEVEQNSQLFEKNLKPLFTLISATSKPHVMDKLSISLKKALLLMAMERYSYDSESMCRALGITKGKLEKELKRCGLPHQERHAA